MWFKFKSKLKIFFPALKHRNFRLYFVGQAVSLIGTWLQQVAEQWLVYAIMTNSTLALGILSAAHGLPVTLFALVAGAVADEKDKRKVLICTQTLMMILAFILAFLVFTKKIAFWQVVFLGALLGLANAFDWPTRQAFWPEIVDDKKDIKSAIALNSAVFNTSRVIGPAIAAFAIGIIGIAACFFFNGISFLAVIVALFFIKTKSRLNQNKKQPILRNIKEGFSYLKHHREPLLLILLMSFCSFFVWSFATLLPIYAKNIFSGNEKIFGFFGAAIGFGATFGALIVSYLSEKLNRIKLLFFSNLLLIFSVLAFAISKNLIFSIIMLVIAGFGFSIFNTLDNSLIQEIIPDYIRGRIMSIYVLMFGGVMPFGSMYIAFLANYFGVALAVSVGLIISLFFLFLVFSYFNLGRRLEALLATTK